MTARILVADDDEGARVLMADLLAIRGYRVTTVCDGIQTMENLENSRPDLVLLDIEMPGLNGCEVCRRMKANPETRSIPVLLVSGVGDIADRARQAGADAFLSKPFSLDNLHMQVSDLLIPHRLPRNAVPSYSMQGWI